MSIKLRTADICTAGLAALLAAWVPAPALSADLEPEPHAYAPYDDPRYADIYRHPPPPPRPRAYVERGYDRTPPPPPSAYAYRPAPPREAYGCVPREVVHAELARRGWHDLHNVEATADVVYLRARRTDGVIFSLTLDRCTGQIIDRRFVAAPPPAYAWRERGSAYRPYY